MRLAILLGILAGVLGCPTGEDVTPGDDDVSGDDDASADDDSAVDDDDDHTEGVDGDGDGWTVGEGDCDDGDGSIYPGAAEIPCDGIDSNCNGVGHAEVAVVAENDHDTLQSALDESVDGDVITVCPGTHPTQAVLDRDIALEIRSWTGDPEDTVLSGAGSSRILEISAPAALVLRDLGFADGAATYEPFPTCSNMCGGAVCSLAVDLTIHGCRFTDGWAEGDGGALCIVDEAPAGDPQPTLSVDVQDTVFEGNEAGGNDGGAIYLSPSHIHTVADFDGVAFSGNVAEYAGGGLSGDGSRPLELTMTNSSFHDNRAESFGGGLDLGGAGQAPRTAWVTDCVFEENAASVGGGAIRQGGDVVLNIHRSILVSNGDRGAVHCSAAELSITSSHFEGNATTASGGAVSVSNSGGSLQLSDTVFQSNTAQAAGGAVDIGTASAPDALPIAAQIEGCTFDLNLAGTQGGAIGTGGWQDTELTITDTVFRANYAAESGGALQLGGPLTQLDCTLDSTTLDGNDAGSCGGIALDSSPDFVNLDLVDSTVVSQGGGAVCLGIAPHHVLTSVDTDWGEGPTENNPFDILAGEVPHSYPGIASFVCVGTGTCI